MNMWMKSILVVLILNLAACSDAEVVYVDSATGKVVEQEEMMPIYEKPLICVNGRQAITVNVYSMLWRLDGLGRPIPCDENTKANGEYR